MQDPILDALVYRIPKVAGDGIGIGPEEAKIAEAIQGYGHKAIPLILPYLTDSEYGVRQLAGYILRDISGLNESHLTPLITAAREGNDWLPPAIAQIGTSRAIAFLAEELRRVKNADSQIGVAFGRLGTKGVPTLCHLVRTHSPKDSELASAIITIFARLNDTAKQSAAIPLRNLAIDTALPIANRQTAIYALSELGEPGRRFVPVLQDLARRNPQRLGETVQNALTSLEASEAVPGLLVSLKRREDRVVYRDIASLEERGRAAGPEIVRRFTHTNWDIRVMAARTVGFIQYTEAIPALILLLSNTEDWRLVRVAAESLGRLQAGQALGALQRVAAQHWYLPVREAAQKAIAHIQWRAAYPKTPPNSNFAFTFFGFEYLPKHAVPKAPKNAATRSYTIPGGKFAGRNDGEWGGDLTFLRSDGTRNVLLRQNVIAVTPFRGKIAVITGLAHLYYNFGDLYLLTRTNTNGWLIKRWRTLPGAPSWAAIRQDACGEVLRIACLGGTVDFMADGLLHAR